MPKEKTYTVRSGFAAVDKEANRKVYFTPANAHRVTEVLSAKEIKERIESGHLAENLDRGDRDDVPLEASAPEPVETENETQRPKGRGGKR